MVKKVICYLEDSERQFIYDFMKKQHMSIRDLAKLCGVSGAYIHSVMSGNRAVNEERYNQMLELINDFDCSLKVRKSNKTNKPVLPTKETE